MAALKKDGTPRKAPVRKPVPPLWEQQPVPHEKPQYLQPPNTDVWWCAGCGARYCFVRAKPGLRGGPTERMVDRRYGFYSCWRALKDPTGKQYHAKGARVFLVADKAPNPMQPAQDPKLVSALTRQPDADAVE